jgi:hypothetical protein
MDTFILIVSIVKLRNILIRGIIDLWVFFKKKRLEQAKKQEQKLEQPNSCP